MFLEILAMAIVMLGLDAVWLYNNFFYYNHLIKNIQKTPLSMRLAPTVLIYIIMPVTVFFYGVLNSKSLFDAFLKGAGLGFAMYGLYDLTNYATLERYTLEATIKDMTWGTILCGLGGLVGYAVMSQMKKLKQNI